MVNLFKQLSLTIVIKISLLLFICNLVIILSTAFDPTINAERELYWELSDSGKIIPGYSRIAVEGYKPEHFKGRIFRYVFVKIDELDRVKGLIEQSIATDKSLMYTKTGHIKYFSMFDKYTSQISDTLLYLFSGGAKGRIRPFGHRCLKDTDRGWYLPTPSYSQARQIVAR